MFRLGGWLYELCVKGSAGARIEGIGGMEGMHNNNNNNRRLVTLAEGMHDHTETSNCTCDVIRVLTTFF